MIVVNLDMMMAKRKISLNELAERVEITPANCRFSNPARPVPSASAPSSASAKCSTASPPTCSNTETTKKKIQ